ncbi:MAG TPA: hypothetical protein PK948_06625 [Gemmatimonadales bacterium]|nr:hypothetical protein [Gemmatimonadales bacterium]
MADGLEARARALLDRCDGRIVADFPDDMAALLAFARSERALALEAAADADAREGHWSSEDRLRARAAQERGGGDGR